MATHSCILAWRIPRTEEPGRLQSSGSQRVGHHWATKHSTLDLRLEQSLPQSQNAEVWGFRPLLGWCWCPRSFGQTLCRPEIRPLRIEGFAEQMVLISLMYSDTYAEKTEETAGWIQLLLLKTTATGTDTWGGGSWWGVGRTAATSSLKSEMEGACLTSTPILLVWQATTGFRRNMTNYWWVCNSNSRAVVHRYSIESNLQTSAVQ